MKRLYGHVHAYVCVCMYVCIYIYIYTYIHIHVYTYIHIYIYIYIYTHREREREGEKGREREREREREMCKYVRIDNEVDTATVIEVSARGTTSFGYFKRACLLSTMCADCIAYARLLPCTESQKPNTSGS